MAIGEVIELIGDVIGYTAEALAGWRYLLSSAYRRRVHARWRGQSWQDTLAEVLTIALSFVLVTVVLVAAGWALLSRVRGSA